MHADVLDADLVELTSRAGPVKVVANVPFNITTGWTLPQPLVLGLDCQGYEEILRHLQRLLTCHRVAAELLKLLLPLPNVASVNLMLQVVHPFLCPHLLPLFPMSLSATKQTYLICAQSGIGQRVRNAG